ncbi:membrane hypothetical protein [groundwater metagenome]|uniref:Uncharacterized protein n=1 Tax=groundwater metagenome TaxID=717931 RepID=A0A098ED70_9ZZZZ
MSLSYFATCLMATINTGRDTSMMKKGFGIVPVNIDKDVLLLILILIIWFFVAIILKIHPLGIVVYSILLFPLFAVGLFLSKRNAIVAGIGFFIGFYIKQSLCFNTFSINDVLHFGFLFNALSGISVTLFACIIGKKLNIKQFSSVWIGIIGFVVIFVIYYFMFSCGMS